jgi:chaperonin GroES
MANIKKLLGDRCLVRMDEPPSKVGSIIIPDRYRESYKGKAIIGTVELLGTGKRKEDGTREPFEFGVGSRVRIGEWAGTDFNPGGVPFKLVRSDEVVAVDEA